jgi:protein SCO1/2
MARIFVWVFLAATFVGSTSCTDDAFKGSDVSAVTWGGDFELTAHTGQRVKSADLRGKVLVLFFGFTHCPDICTPTLTKLAQALKLLGDDADRVQVLFVTVDPKHDTPTQLAQFLRPFGPSFLGLSGTDTEISKVAREHRVPYLDGNQQSPLNHSGVVLIKDRMGKLRLLFQNEFTPADLAHDVRLLAAD